MKIKIIIAISLIAAITVIARMIPSFSGWNHVPSTDVIIAHCAPTAPSTSGFVLVLNGPNSDSPIKVLAVLKGTNNISSSRLLTDYLLQEGENYLVLGNYDGGSYQAYEEYRVIPLGRTFSTNLIAGKPYEEQIQILFKRRIDDLNREIQNDEAEKQRLEEGIKR